jgi:hypothetical protein
MKKGFWWKEAQRQRVQVILVFTLSHPKHLHRECKCIWHIFTLASCKCKIKYIHCNRISVNKKNLEVCKRKWFTLTLDLHVIYIAIDTYMHNTGFNIWIGVLVQHWYPPISWEKQWKKEVDHFEKLNACWIAVSFSKCSLPPLCRQLWRKPSTYSLSSIFKMPSTPLEDPSIYF